MHAAQLGLFGAFNLNLQVMKLLAVVGGAALGYMLVGALLRFAGRFLPRDRVPRAVQLAVRLLGGFTTGLLVYLWLFGVGGSGGWGSGGGGWVPFGGTGGEEGGANQKGKDPLRDQPAPPRAATLRVDLLGGTRVKEQRFYMLEGSDRALTFEELTQAVGERRKLTPPIAGLRIVLHPDSVDRSNPAVRQLERWARDQGLTPELAAP